MSATTITYGPADNTVEFAVERGEEITVYTTDGGEVTGSFVSVSAAKGVRLHDGSRYVTRRIRSIEHIARPAAEVTPEPVAEVAPEPVAVEAAPAARTEISIREVPAEVIGGADLHYVLADSDPDNAAAASLRVMEIRARGGRRLPRAAAAPQVPAPAPAPAVTVTDVFDPDPMVDGRKLSEMRFPEVMKLAQRYRTPGRGVARIAALREGVARAIAAETVVKIRATAALIG